MRFLSALLATVAVATAQSPLTTTFVNNNAGAAGGGVYFNLTNITAPPAPVTICQMAVNLNSAIGTAGTIDLFATAAGGSSVPHTQAWGAPVSTAAVVSAGPGQPTLFTLSAPLTIAPGTTRGVAIRATTVANAYTNGTGAYPVPGNHFINADLDLNAGQASNVFGAGAAFTPRMVNCRLFYLVGAAVCPPAATVTPQGLGCDPKFTSFYEMLTKPTFDLSGHWITMTNTGSGYVVQFIPNCPLFPIGALGPAAIVPLTDDSSAAVGTMGATVGSNGWVQVGPGVNSLGFTPDIPTLLNNPGTAAYSWKDFNPAIVGSGQVWYEQDAAGRQFRVTFDGVWIFGGTSVADASFFQFTYNSNTGDWIISWGVTAVTGTNWLVGYSPGGPSANPGPRDLDSAIPFQIFNIDQLALSLVGVGRPVQMANATPYQVTTGNIDTTQAFAHLGIIGLLRPGGIPLVFLGAPNCFLNASPDIILGPVLGGPFLPSTVTWTPLVLPPITNPFFGFEFNCQGAILGTPKNPALGVGILTSNGLKCVIGGI